MRTDDDGAEGQPDGAPEEGAPPEEEVPPAKTVEIEDLAGDFSSAYEALDGGVLSRDDAVAVARLAAADISSSDGDGVLVGKSLTDLCFVIGEVGGRSGEVRVREVVFRDSVDIALTTRGELEDTLTGPDSRERRGAARLVRALTSSSRADLFETLGTLDNAVASRLEELLKLFAQGGVDLDIQTPRERPVRVAASRSAALWVALTSDSRATPTNTFVNGRLVGAIADTRDFKLRLQETWGGRSVMEGKFPPELDDAVDELYNQGVRATVSVDVHQRGVRAQDFRFSLKAIEAAPELPLI